MSSFFSFWESLSSWERADIVGLLMVAVGVLGELALRFERIKKLLKFPFNPTNFSPLDFRKNLLEIIFELLVFVGLGIEVYALPNLINESHIEIAGLNKQTEQLRNDRLGLEKQVNETKTQLANAEARLNESVIELKNANLPMDIGEQYSFANALKPLAGIQVELRTVADGKAQQTAESLRSTFLMAGWPVINSGLIGDIGEEGVVIGYNGDDPSLRAAHLLLKLLTDKGVPSEFAVMARVALTNTIIVAVCQRPSQLKANLMVVRAKETELQDQILKIWTKRMGLSTNRYIIGSKEMASAQAEFNDLNSQFWKLQNEQPALFEQERNLNDQREKEVFGTNSTAPGLYMYNNSFNNIAAPLVAGTNSSKIRMYDTHINPVPLQ
jgi:hypothetical protein